MSYFSKETVEFDDLNQSVFGVLETAGLEPVVQLDFVSGINTQTGQSTVSGTGATVDTNSGRLRVQSGTSSTGSAIFNTRNIAKYRPGQGMNTKFSAIFDSGIANNRRFIGPGNAVDGYFFGYSGTTFGILHRNNSSDSDFTAQSSWNVDKCDGTGPSGFTLDPSKGNVFMIKYPYLGYGDAKFFIEDSNTGRYIEVHIMKYANLNTATEVTNPNLNFWVENVNSGNTTNKAIYNGSFGIFISGIRSYVSMPRWAADNNKSAITSETNIISLKNCTSYNGVTNKSLIRLNSISLGNDGKGITVLRVRIGATVGGSPSFSPIDGSTSDGGVTITSGNSIASVDTAGTTATGGTYIFNITNGFGGNQLIDLTPLDLFVAPGEIITFSAFATAASIIGVSINWSED